MPQAARILIVEFPGTGLAGTDFTRQHPGVTIDTIGESAIEKPDGTYLPMLLMLRGATPQAMGAFLERMTKAYGKFVTLRRDVRTGVWIGRGTIKESDMHNAGMEAILQFQNRFGVPWFHAEGGVVHVRAVLGANEDADRLVRQMEGYLAEKKVDAQVEVQEVSAHDYSVWDELVQYSLGLSV